LGLQRVIKHEAARRLETRKDESRSGVCIEPLSSEEVGKYLAAAGSKLAALREAVGADPVLQELAQTPLMLSIMSLAFQGAGGSELASASQDSQTTFDEPVHSRRYCRQRSG
jgi:hypothetical protein